MDGVGCAPVPLGIDPLLRWDGKDEFAQLRVENRPPSSDVAVQRVGFILNEHGNFAKPRIEAIAQGHVDDAVFASKGHRRFCAVLGEREETFAAATRKDHGIDIKHGGHDIKWPEWKEWVASWLVFGAQAPGCQCRLDYL